VVVVGISLVGVADPVEAQAANPIDNPMAIRASAHRWSTDICVSSLPSCRRILSTRYAVRAEGAPRAALRPTAAVASHRASPGSPVIGGPWMTAPMLSLAPRTARCCAFLRNSAAFARVRKSGQTSRFIRRFLP
jgi:hypothetical protein